MIQFRRKKRGGFSLIEVVITMTILAILVTFAAPSVIRTMEQSHADLAGAGLRSIATAQRFFWLENRVYADNLQQLIDAELVDAPMVNVSPRYEFAITNADASGFTATARRRTFNSAGNTVYDGAYQGQFSIDESGNFTGTVSVAGGNSTIQPGF